MYIKSIIGLLALFVFGMVLIVGNIVLSGFVDELGNSGTYDPRVDEAVDDVSTRLPQALDFISVMVITGLVIGGIVASLMADVHPVFFGLLFFISISLLFGPMLLSNMWTELVEEDDIISSTTSYPVTNFFLKNYLWVWLGVNSLFFFVILVRNRL